jgi:hypothetical protein
LAYTIQFWRGGCRLFGIAAEGCMSTEDAANRVSAILGALINDDEDWTGCRLEVVTECGIVILVAPVLPSMSAIARQSCQQ